MPVASNESLGAIVDVFHADDDERKAFFLFFFRFLTMTFSFYLLRHSEERFRSCNILFYQHRVLCLRLYLSVAVIHLCRKKRAATETLGESPPQPQSMEPPGQKYQHIQGTFIYFYTFSHQNFAA